MKKDKAMEAKQEKNKKGADKIKKWLKRGGKPKVKRKENGVRRDGNDKEEKLKRKKKRNVEGNLNNDGRR